MSFDANTCKCDAEDDGAVPKDTASEGCECTKNGASLSAGGASC